MNPVRTDYNSARSSIEAHLRASLRPIETSDLVAFKSAVQELNETQVGRLSDFMPIADKTALENLQNQNDEFTRKNQRKLISLKNITKLAVGILIFLGACICHCHSQHALGLFLFGLAFAAVDKLCIDLKHHRNFPKVQKRSFELFKNVQQTKVAQLTNQILTVKNDKLQAKLEAIKAEKNAIAAEKDAVYANIEIIVLERIGEIANHLINVASSNPSNSDANQENSHCTIEELV